jgi:hypothetical protein
MRRVVLVCALALWAYGCSQPEAEATRLRPQASEALRPTRRFRA